MFAILSERLSAFPIVVILSERLPPFPSFFHPVCTCVSPSDEPLPVCLNISPNVNVCFLELMPARISGRLLKCLSFRRPALELRAIVGIYELIEVAAVWSFGVHSTRLTVFLNSFCFSERQLVFLNILSKNFHWWKTVNVLIFLHGWLPKQ
jgi:hypothetical protein